MSYDQERAAAFATRLRGILKDRKLTQLQVMRDTSISQQAISGWCRGLHLPRADGLQELADYLQMEPRALCPEAFDDAAVRTLQSKITFGPVDDQDGWYVLKINPGLMVDEEMLQDVLAANRRFAQRKKSGDFTDVKLK